MGVIMDLKGNKSSREDDRSSGNVSGDVEDKKACTDCKTTKTPLWRGGPAGPKFLPTWSKFVIDFDLMVLLSSMGPLANTFSFLHGFFLFWLMVFNSRVVFFPQSLCNACGIRYRKKRTMMRLEKGPEKKREKTTTSNTTTSTDISTITTATTTNSAQAVSGNGLISESLRMSLMVLGEEMMLQRPSVVKKQRCQRKRKLREEEQAAFSLMALSCGSVFA
ncbi:hypothetical protein SADUNF_Sadunf05G0010400 [Salix dunnii]|uniref:GATA-type domain-containing protein n=1 Tax=Salix dunnii TaxID=1413687 RepID=A0A835K664_9ROSI|nr:hypothetical protein SADUNF_Sadunf05G0010400 [Salix dunnii]